MCTFWCMWIQDLESVSRIAWERACAQGTPNNQRLEPTPFTTINQYLLRSFMDRPTNRSGWRAYDIINLSIWVSNGKTPLKNALSSSLSLHPVLSLCWVFIWLETNLASRWWGVKLPRASGKFPKLPRKFPELPRKFSATSPEVLSLWNLTAIQRFPGSFPNFPGSSPNFPGSSRTSPEVSPFLWEAWHPLLTHKNFLWFEVQDACTIARWRAIWLGGLEPYLWFINGKTLRNLACAGGSENQVSCHNRVAYRFFLPRADKIDHIRRESSNKNRTKCACRARKKIRILGNISLCGNQTLAESLEALCTMKAPSKDRL